MRGSRKGADVWRATLLTVAIVAVLNMAAKKLATLSLPPGEPLCDLSWSPDGAYLAVDVGTAGGGRELIILDGASRQPVASLGYAWSYCWAPLSAGAGRALVAFGSPRDVDPPLPVEDGRSCDVAVFDVKTGESRLIAEGTPSELLFPSAWLPDGRI